MKKRGRKKKEKKCFSHLTYTERLQLEALLKAGTPVDTIAELLQKTDLQYIVRKKGADMTDLTEAITLCIEHILPTLPKLSIGRI